MSRVSFICAVFSVVTVMTGGGEIAWGFGKKSGTSNPQKYNVAVEAFEGSVEPNARVGGATITFAGQTKGADGEGYALFPGVGRGTHTARLEAPGFDAVEVAVSISGHRDHPFPDTQMPSIRVPMNRSGGGQAYQLVVEVFDGNVGGRRIGGAEVTIDNELRSSDGNGFTHFFIAGGSKQIQVSAAGFETTGAEVILDSDRDQVYPAEDRASVRVALGRAVGARRTGRIRLENRSVADDGGQFDALGATFMWALWGLKHDRGRLEQNLGYLQQNGYDYVRILGGQLVNSYWRGREVDVNWPDYEARIAEITDLAYDVYGLRVEWTIFGGAEDLSRERKRQVVDQFIRMSQGREHKIMHWEIANESWQTGFPGDAGKNELRELTRYLNDRTDIPVAISAPETSDYCADAQSLYAGGIADIGTVHFDRDIHLGDGAWRPVRQPWEYNYCTVLPTVGSNNEPIGPGSSVAADEDPLRMVSAALNTYLSGLPLYVFHSNSGIRGDTNFWDYADGATRAFQAMRSYLPNGLANWNRQSHHWGEYPFNVQGEVGYPPSSGSGMVRGYGALNGSEFFINAIGINDYVDMQAKHNMIFDVIHPLTGQVLGTHVLNGGQTFRLQGAQSLVLKGRYL